MGIEEEAEKHVDLVLQLEKDVKLLKKKVGKLTKQIDEQILITGFQEQLNAFDKKLATSEAKSLETSRLLASLHIECFRIFLEMTVLNSRPIDFPELKQFTLSRSIKADEEIKHSLTPDTIVRKFRADCESYCKTKSLHFFRE